MTTNEIKALVAKKLAGQGTNVDAASVLPTIINALCDAVEAAQAAAPKTLIITEPSLTYELTKEEFAEALGITTAEVDALFAGDYKYISYSGTILAITWFEESRIVAAGAEFSGVALDMAEVVGFSIVDSQYYIDVYKK